jgi:hypothetical protein
MSAHLILLDLITLMVFREASHAMFSVVSFSPGRFTPSERVPGTHWIEGRVYPRAVLEMVVKRKIPSPRRESNPRNSIMQPVAQRYTDWEIYLWNFGNTIEIHKEKAKFSLCVERCTPIAAHIFRTYAFWLWSSLYPLMPFTVDKKSISSFLLF